MRPFLILGQTSWIQANATVVFSVVHGRNLDHRAAQGIGRARPVFPPVEVVVDGTTDQVLGAAQMMVHSQEIINLLAHAMRHGITTSALRDSIYTQPSSTEGLNEVLSTLK